MEDRTVRLSSSRNSNESMDSGDDSFTLYSRVTLGHQRLDDSGLSMESIRIMKSSAANYTSKHQTPRRSVTPIPHLPPDSQARIYRAQQHLENDDSRTGYTYAETKTYQTRGADREYESPRLARVPLHHHDPFTPDNSIAIVPSTNVVGHLSYAMHQFWHVLTMPTRFGAYILSTTDRRAANILYYLLLLLLLLLLLVFVANVQHREQNENMSYAHSRLHDFYTHLYAYTDDSLLTWRDSAYNACASLGAAARGMFEFDLAPTGGVESVGTVVSWLWAQPAALWAAVSRSHVNASHFDDQQPSTSGACLPPLSYRDTQLASEVYALRERVDSLLARSVALTSASITSRVHDLDEVEQLIVAALRRYDADKTGRVDYALESAGGQIVSTRRTRTYSSRTRRESVYGIPLWYSSVSPRSVIQRKSQSIIPGECWAFEGAVGYLLIGLIGTIRVTAVTYEHIPLSMSPDGHLDSAPKLFQLWGYQTVNDPNAMQIAEFTYTNNDTVDTMQTFELDAMKFPAASKPWPMVEVRVLSNHGHPTYTCMYRFRVHGQRA